MFHSRRVDSTHFDKPLHIPLTTLVAFDTHLQSKGVKVSPPTPDGTRLERIDQIVRKSAEGFAEQRLAHSAWMKDQPVNTFEALDYVCDGQKLSLVGILQRDDNAYVVRPYDESLLSEDYFVRRVIEESKMMRT